MVSVPEWEYHYRWAEMAGSLAEMADELEARDQALEAHLRDGYGSSTCFIQFEYTYRWADILAQPQDVQIALLEANMQALEDAVTAAGGCPLEFPYRWAQFLPALAQGEGWAIACAEENDRAIEARFNECSCGAVGIESIRVSGVLSGDPTFAEYGFETDNTLSTPISILFNSIVISEGDPEDTSYTLTLYHDGFAFFTEPLISGADTGTTYDIGTPENFLEGDFIKVEISSISGALSEVELFVYFDGTGENVELEWSA